TRFHVTGVQTCALPIYVLEAMHKHGAVLGGEQSGHIILADEGHLAGDGLYTALRVIEVMLDSGKPLSELCRAVSKFPQTIVNVKIGRASCRESGSVQRS